MSGSSAPSGHSARTEANARLTSASGLILFVLLAAQGVTILRIHSLLTAHFALGFALLGPVALKLASTGWRFARYYLGDADYVRAGPPRPALRLLAPVLVISTVGVFGSGVALAVVSPSRASFLVFVHKATFVLWFAVTTVHVLAYLPRAFERSVADLTGRGAPAVRATRLVRQIAVIVSVAAGAALGIAAAGWSHAWRA